MEIKNWSYDEFPAYDEPTEGAVWLETTGKEIGELIFHDVVYCEMNGTPLKLQIIVPECREMKRFFAPDAPLDDPERPKFPCIMFVKGSAWFEQNLYMNLGEQSKLARRGFVVAEVEYRHSGIASFPAPAVDARNAVRYMRVNAKKWFIDPEKIIMMGNSSGGHTAVYAGILHNDDDPAENLFPGVSAEVKGIINHYGSTDFLFEDSNPMTVNHNMPDSPEGREMGGINMREDEAAARKLTVRANIFPDTEIAPVLNIHGTKDRTVNCKCSVYLHQRLKECGKDSELVLLKGADHGGSEFFADAVLDLEVAFIERCLAK